MNNSITVVGRVSQTPHAVSFGDTGNKVVKFPVAVKEFSANRDEDRVMFIDVDAWNGIGERVLKILRKGREVVVQGRLAISTYPKKVNGVKVEMKKPVIKLTSFHVCSGDPAEKNEAQGDESKAGTPKDSKK
jgi:single stranded DNA-binding protein